MRRLRIASALFTVAAVSVLCLATDDTHLSVGRLRADRRFGKGGIMRSIRGDGGQLDIVQFMEMDAEGRLVLAGVALDAASFTGSRPVVARLFQDGRLDKTFGFGGIAALPLQGFVRGFAMDRDGRFVICSSDFRTPGVPSVH